MIAIESILANHRATGVAIDTNLLTLFVVGLIDPDAIARFKRTCMFTVEDFHLLHRFLRLFNRRVLTPQVLAETSNLLGQCANPRPAKLRQVLRYLILDAEEIYEKAGVLVESGWYLDFGLTDAGLASLTQQDILLLTDDFPLSNRLASQDRPVVNFNHLRSFGLLH